MTTQIEIHWRNAAPVTETFPDRLAAEQHVYNIMTSDAGKELENVIYKTGNNPYLSQVNGLKFNVAAFAKLLESQSNPVHRGKDYPYWNDSYKFLNGEEINVSITEQLENIPEEARQILLSGVKDSFETYGANKSPDDMGRVLQYDLKEDFERNIRKMLPECIRSKYIRFTYQKIADGNFHHAHIDHDRPTTLFYLLSEPAAETHWYELKPTSKELYKDKQHMIRSLGPSHMFRQYKTVIQPGRWYLFNNNAYHSVHLLPGYEKINRTTFIIDFLEMSYADVAAMLVENGMTVEGEDLF